MSFATLENKTRAKSRHNKNKSNRSQFSSTKDHRQQRSIENPAIQKKDNAGFSFRSISIRPTILNTNYSSKTDKSVSEESEMQDQNASVTSLTGRHNGIIMRVEAEGLYSSEEYDEWRWTQTIDTNVPLGGSTSPYVDPRPNDDSKPFYWTDSEYARYPTTFVDYPKRPAPATGTTYWNATLALNGVNNAKKEVTAFDNVSYGFTRDSAGNVNVVHPTSTSLSTHRATLSSEFSGWTFL